MVCDKIGKDVMAGFEDLLDDYLPSSEETINKEESEKNGRGESRVGCNPHNLGAKRLRRRLHEETFDLHGYTGREAEGEFPLILKECRRRKIRKGLIVHGKGVHSPQGSILQPLVWKLLEREPRVMEYGYANFKNGGNGATWFILRGE